MNFKNILNLIVIVTLIGVGNNHASPLPDDPNEIITPYHKPSGSLPALFAQNPLRCNEDVTGLLQKEIQFTDDRGHMSRIRVTIPFDKRLKTIEQFNPVERANLSKPLESDLQYQYVDFDVTLPSINRSFEKLSAIVYLHPTLGPHDPDFLYAILRANKDNDDCLTILPYMHDDIKNDQFSVDIIEQVQIAYWGGWLAHQLMTLYDAPADKKTAHLLGFSRGGVVVDQCHYQHNYNLYAPQGSLIPKNLFDTYTSIAGLPIVMFNHDSPYHQRVPQTLYNIFCKDDLYDGLNAVALYQKHTDCEAVQYLYIPGGHDSHSSAQSFSIKLEIFAESYFKFFMVKESYDDAGIWQAIKTALSKAYIKSIITHNTHFMFQLYTTWPQYINSLMPWNRWGLHYDVAQNNSKGCALFNEDGSFIDLDGNLHNAGTFKDFLEKTCFHAVCIDVTGQSHKLALEMVTGIIEFNHTSQKSPSL